MSVELKPPTLPWSVKITLSLLSKVTDFSRKSNGTINRTILRYLEPTAKVPAQPVDGVKITDVMIDPSRNLWFRLYVPTTTDEGNDSSENCTKLPVMVFFHGGAFAFMSPDSKMFDMTCRRISRDVDAVIVSVNYRLAPEYKYPCQYEDGFDVLKFLDKGDIKGFPRNADVSRCFLAGDSAGGNISHNVSRHWAEEEHTFDRLKVVGLIPIQPFFGGEERTDSESRLDGIAPLVDIKRCDWHWNAYIPEGSNRDHEAVNVFGPNAIDISMLKNFPSALVVVGGFDPLQDWQRRYYEGLKKSGVDARLIEYPDAIHGFYIFPQLPESSLFISQLKNFVHGEC